MTPTAAHYTAGRLAARQAKERGRPNEQHPGKRHPPKSFIADPDWYADEITRAVLAVPQSPGEDKL